MVLLGEIRHCWSTLFAFTRPYFGTASSMSNTFAVEMKSGGSSRLRISVPFPTPLGPVMTTTRDGSGAAGD